MVVSLSKSNAATLSLQKASAIRLETEPKLSDQDAYLAKKAEKRKLMAKHQEGKHHVAAIKDPAAAARTHLALKS